MSEPVCDACQDEPVLASGGLCPRCAYVARSNGADLSRLRAAVEALAGELAAKAARGTGPQEGSVPPIHPAYRRAMSECADRLRPLLRPGDDASREGT